MNKSHCLGEGYTMKVAVAGAGMAGSYMYRLLKDEGFEEVDLYDRKKTTRCGGRPCAWGFAPTFEFYRLLSEYIDCDRFVMRRWDSIEIDDVAMKADMLTVNKPALIKELIGDAEVRYDDVDVGAYDRVIDATGVERAYLGPVDGDELLADLTQRRIWSEEPLGAWIRTSSLGYEWCFPLGENEYHIGFGNLKSSAEDFQSSIEPAIMRGKTLCQCPPVRLRMSSPYESQPFVVKDKIVGIGESIGTVGPLGGDGNIYAMQTAELLKEHWNDLERYSEEVLIKFRWMGRERQGLERLLGGSMPTVADIRAFVVHARRAGFGMGPVNAMRYFKKALEADGITPRPR
jgi:flavin-dependent dehydrogenase